MPRLAILTTEQKQFLDQLIRKVETGADWAEIARLEAEMLDEPCSPLEPQAKDWARLGPALGVFFRIVLLPSSIHRRLQVAASRAKESPA
jgi:hypothetical protein